MRVNKIPAHLWEVNEEFEFPHEKDEHYNYIDMKGSHTRLMKLKHDHKEKVVRKFKKNTPYADAQELERVSRRGTDKRKKTARILPVPDEDVRGAIPSPDVTGSAVSVPPLRPPQDVHSNVPPLYPDVKSDGDGTKTSRI